MPADDTKKKSDLHEPNSDEKCQIVADAPSRDSGSLALVSSDIIVDEVAISDQDKTHDKQNSNANAFHNEVETAMTLDSETDTLTDLSMRCAGSSPSLCEVC